MSVCVSLSVFLCVSVCSCVLTPNTQNLRLDLVRVTLLVSTQKLFGPYLQDVRITIFFEFQEVTS